MLASLHKFLRPDEALRLKEALATGPMPETSTALACWAAQRGFVFFLNALRRANVPLGTDFAATAAYYGQLPVLQWACDFHVPFDYIGALETAVEQGNTAIVTWCWLHYEVVSGCNPEGKIPLFDGMLNVAISDDTISIVNLIYCMKIPWEQHHSVTVAQHNSRAAATFMREKGCTVPPLMLRLLVDNDRLALLDILYPQGRTLKPPRFLAQYAQKKGNRKVLEWLQRWPSSDSGTDELFDGSSEGDNAASEGTDEADVLEALRKEFL